MTASSAPGVQARSANDTTSMLLPDPSRQFAPVSARWNTEDEFHVTAIASDGDNGFVVTYVAGGEERSVHFEADDYGTPQGQHDYYTETGDGGRFWLWSPFGSFQGGERNLGSPDYDFVDAYGTSVYGYDAPNRQYLAFGSRTDPANLPTGAADYVGRLYAETLDADDYDRALRGRLRGNWRLTADFSASTLRGEVRAMEWIRPGDSDWSYAPRTTYFRIEGGRIVDGQFTASVSGVDSDPNASANHTLSGFEGSMLGEFHGPAAEEAGGAVRASRESDNRVLVGSFVGKQAPELDPTIPEGNVSFRSVGVYRDAIARTFHPTDSAAVTAVESDGANGLHVTYRVNGVDRRIHLEDQFYSGEQYGFGLQAQTADALYVLYDQTGSFVGMPEFDHFNVHQWATIILMNHEIVEAVPVGFVVYGVPTEAADLPAGTATYEGRARFQGWVPGSPRTPIDGAGRLRLDADFDAGTLGGAIDTIDFADGPLTEFAIEKGRISGGELSADLRGGQSGTDFAGSLDGSFFGPQAAEVGGVLDGEYTEPARTLLVQGWFGGKKQ